MAFFSLSTRKQPGKTKKHSLRGQKKMQRLAKIQQVEPFIHLQGQQLHPSEFKFMFRRIPRSQLNPLGMFE